MKIEETKQKAIEHYREELRSAPAVLSSYMSGSNLPAKYKEIDQYVSGVRINLIKECGNEINQLQMLVLDSICETLIISKYISAYIAENIDHNLINVDKYGISRVSDLVLKGFGGINGILDRKIKQFHDLMEFKEQQQEEDGYIKAIQGKVKTGRPEGSQKPNRIEDDGVYSD